MDKIPAVGGGFTWIRDLFERIRATGWAFGASLLRPPRRRLTYAPHTTPESRHLVGLGIVQQIGSSGSGAIIYFDGVPELEVDRSVILRRGPNSDPDIDSTLIAPGLEQPPSLCSNSERFPGPDANPILTHPLPVRRSGLTIPPGFEKTWLARTQPTYSAVVSQPDSNLRMPPNQLHGSECNPSLMQRPFPVSASAVGAIPHGSPTGPFLEEKLLSSGAETTDSEPEIISDVIRLVHTAALVSGAGAEGERDLQRIISDFDVLPVSEGITSWDLIRRPRMAVNASATETSPKLERIASQVSSDSSDFEVLSGSEESATYYATRTTAGLPSARPEAASDLEQMQNSLSSSDATDSDDLSKPDRKDLSAAEAASDLERTQSSLSSSHATDSDDLYKRDRKDLSATVAANSSAGVLVETEVFKYEGIGGIDSQGVKFTFGFELNPNAKEFIPRAAANSDVFPVYSRQNLSDLREGLKLTVDEFQRPPWVEGNAFSLFSSPSDSKLDLGTALRMSFQGANKWTKWDPQSNFSPRSGHSEVVWGSAGRKKPSSSKSEPGVQDHVKVPFGNKSATPPWGWKDRRSQGHRPHYRPSSPVHTLKASPKKTPVAREFGHHVSPRQDVRLESRR